MTDATRTAVAAVPAGLAVIVALWSCAPDAPHGPEMRFPLVGMHEALPCEACHGTDGFEALPTECAACHEPDRPPDHYAGDCGDCHTAYGWLVFGTGTTTSGNPHEAGTFPLVDAHDIPCSSCHVGDGYEGLDGQCTSCHADDEPPYHYIEYPDCDQCHTPTVWTDGRVHPVPLPHHTADCASCHPDAAVRTQFTCTTGCHDEATTEPLHVNVPTYQWVSAECFSCHF